MNKLLGALGWLVFGVGVCLLSVWTLGRTGSDRWLWSQLLSWLPTFLIVTLAVAAWTGSLLLARVGRAKGRGHRYLLRWAFTLWLALAVIHLLIIDLRLYRWPLGPRPTSPHLRIVHWNVTGIQQLEGVSQPWLTHAPDITILVNPHSNAGWAGLERAVSPDYHTTRAAGFVIASRLPILRYGVAWLGLEGLPPETESSLPRRHGWSDPGRAMYLELDTRPSLGRTTIIWALDLPSEPKLPRWKIASDAGGIIRSWRGVEMVVRQDGTAEGVQSAGFPPADVVVGDFNMTRGSASLAALLPGMRHAFDEAGAGYAATWPRAGFRTPIPLFHIDHMFVSAGTAALRYEVVDPGYGYHKMQVGDVVPGGTPLRGVR